MSNEQKPKTPKLITGEDKLKELIKKIIRQELDEMTGTGAVSIPLTKGAFTNDPHGSKKGRKEMEKLGWSVVDEKMDAVGHEDTDVNNDGKSDKTDKYLLKRRRAIAKQQKRKNLMLLLL